MLRVRIPGEHSRVTTFELFFDLVFVFAVTQISHTLAGHLDGEGLLHATVLLLAVWWVWMYTTWATNWCDPDHLVVRIVLVGIMLGGLIMSASIPQAFDGRAFGFVIPYVLIQVGRSGFVLWASRHDPGLARTFIRIVIWFAVSSVFWVAGALAHDGMRVGLWLAALAIEYAGPSATYWLPRIGRARVSDWNVEGAHLAERCGLFIIIALGESLLVTGATFSGLEWNARVVAAMVAAFGAAVSMWWIYFDLTAETGTELIAHSEAPGAIARLAYTYIHLPIVAGIIISAVGDELVLAHPSGETGLATALAIVGGPAVFVFGYALFKRAILGKFFSFHLLVFAALGVLLLAHEALSPLALTASTTTVLIAMAIRGRLGHRSGAGELSMDTSAAG